MKNKIIIGIDGGASKTLGVIFNDSGKTIAYESCLGTNLSVDEEKSSSRIIKLINTLLRKTTIDIKDISAIGIGLAGASNQNGRERLFGLLDNLQLSDKTIITNDVESIYEFIWNNQKGILLNVGTGVICMAKKGDQFIKVAGKGHDNGDIGSGYWIGKEALLEIGINQSALDKTMQEVLDSALIHYQTNNYESLIKSINEDNERISTIASFAKEVILLASQGNELGIEIIQKATRIIAEYIIEIRDIMEYGHEEIILGGNGSILRNDYFRKELNNALSFDFDDIKWIFSDISVAYAPGILSARINNIKVNKKDLKLNPLKNI